MVPDTHSNGRAPFPPPPPAGPGPPLTCRRDFALLPLQGLRRAEEAPQQGALEGQHGPAAPTPLPTATAWLAGWLARSLAAPRLTGAAGLPSTHVQEPAAGSRHDTVAGHAGRTRRRAGAAAARLCTPPLSPLSRSPGGGVFPHRPRSGSV